jgi:hypothetical protein
MRLTITRSRPATPDEWDTAWSSCGYATYFHSRAWSEIWSEYSRGRLTPFPEAIEFSDGARALLPLSREKSLGGITRRIVSSPAGTYGGWLGGDALTAEHDELLLDRITNRESNLFLRENPYLPPLRGNDLAWHTDHTQTLGLSGKIDEIVSRWTKGHRSAVSKALRSGVRVRCAEGERDWQEYFDAYLDSRRRWGAEGERGYDFRLFDAIKRRTDAAGNIRLWVALHSGRVISGALCLYAPQIAVYWHGASLEEFLPLRPANLVLDAAIRDAKDRELKWFDFNPSGGHAGVDAFKRSFGAERKETRFAFVNSAPTRLVARATRVAHGLRGR